MRDTLLLEYLLATAAEDDAAEAVDEASRRYDADDPRIGEARMRLADAGLRALIAAWVVGKMEAAQ